MPGINGDNEMIFTLFPLLLVGLDRRRTQIGRMQIYNQPVSGFAVGFERKAARADFALQIKYHAQTPTALACRTQSTHQVGCSAADSDRLAFASIFKVDNNAIGVGQGEQVMLEFPGQIENDARMIICRLRNTDSGQCVIRFGKCCFRAEQECNRQPVTGHPFHK